MHRLLGAVESLAAPWYEMVRGNFQHRLEKAARLKAEKKQAKELRAAGLAPDQVLSKCLSLDPDAEVLTLAADAAGARLSSCATAGARGAEGAAGAADAADGVDGSGGDAGGCAPAGPSRLVGLDQALLSAVFCVLDDRSAVSMLSAAKDLRRASRADPKMRTRRRRGMEAAAKTRAAQAKKKKKKKQGKMRFGNDKNKKKDSFARGL
eukprot:g4295.t1